MSRAVVVSGGPMLAGMHRGKSVDLISVFEGVGKVKAGTMTQAELAELEGCACPGCRVMCGHVHGELHELPHRGPGPGFAG